MNIALENQINLFQVSSALSVHQPRYSSEDESRKHRRRDKSRTRSVSVKGEDQTTDNEMPTARKISQSDLSPQRSDTISSRRENIIFPPRSRSKDNL